uniref:Uncharacterized protein n=1 Tax=Monostroma angicava TaxID=189348 RepID=A0A7U3NAG3_9CHLO|nr:hypothetical protein [Monostroma angicava]
MLTLCQGSFLFRHIHGRSRQYAQGFKGTVVGSSAFILLMGFWWCAGFGLLGIFAVGIWRSLQRAR